MIKIKKIFLSLFNIKFNKNNFVIGIKIFFNKFIKQKKMMKKKQNIKKINMIYLLQIKKLN